MINQILNKNNIFLIDAFGAILSSILLGIVLPLFSDFLGVSSLTLYLLAAIASLLSIYSLSCFYFNDQKNLIRLKFLALLNTAYCFLTLSLITFFTPNITVFGFIYFILEIIVVIGLIVVEVQIYQKNI